MVLAVGAYEDVASVREPAEQDLDAGYRGRYGVRSCRPFSLHTPSRSA